MKIIHSQRWQQSSRLVTIERFTVNTSNLNINCKSIAREFEMDD